jgi:N-acetylglucosaminyldiphosphoundecaprenol N-acetyl-beta-D-mannosaminyltransferase
MDWRRCNQRLVGVTMASELARQDFVGIEFVSATYEELAGELDRLARLDAFSLIVTPNVDHVVVLHRSLDDPVAEKFRDAYSVARICLCDSRVLQTLASLCGVRLKVLTGSDLTAFLFEQGWLDGRQVALVGGDASMLAELNVRYPGVKLTQHIPPMGVLENEAAIREIEAFVTSQRFDYVLFAIGAPRSEIIAHRIMMMPGVTGVAICIGASIEFMLGRKARAPRWVQSLRMEWAFRLLSEPRRLWRRYLVSGPKVLKIVWQWLKR